MIVLVNKMFDNIEVYRKNAKEGKKLIDINASDKIIEVIKNVYTDEKE